MQHRCTARRITGRMEWKVLLWPAILTLYTKFPSLHLYQSQVDASQQQISSLSGGAAARTAAVNIYRNEKNKLSYNATSHATTPATHRTKIEIVM